MTTIVSKRARAANEEKAARERRERRFLSTDAPLTPGEKDHIHRVFEEIKRQLDSMGKKHA